MGTIRALRLGKGITKRPAANIKKRGAIKTPLKMVYLHPYNYILASIVLYNAPHTYLALLFLLR